MNLKSHTSSSFCISTQENRENYQQGNNALWSRTTCILLKEKVCVRAKVARAYHGFSSMKRLGVLLVPLDGMLVHRRLPWEAFHQVAPTVWLVPIYTPGWRGVMWELKCFAHEHNTMTPASLKPRQLDLEPNELTIRPMYLPKKT